MFKTDWAKVIEIIVKVILGAYVAFYGIRRLIYGRWNILNLDDPLQVKLLFFFILTLLLYGILQIRKGSMK